jgi:hypothetical protein
VDFTQILDRRQERPLRPDHGSTDHSQTAEQGRYAAASAAFKRGLKVPELA